MAEDQSKRIEVYLSSKKKSKDTISALKMKQLCKIDEVIQEKVRVADEAKKALEKSAINISTVAEATGIARRTFYNNDILKDYVEKYSSKSAISARMGSEKSSTTEALQKENKELKRQIDRFLERDIETGKLWHENEKLHKEIERLNAQVETLQAQNERLQMELAEAKINSPSNIIHLPKLE